MTRHNIRLVLFGLPVAAIALIAISCTGPNGPDGNDGAAYLTVTTSYGYLYAYVDDNTSRPGVFNGGQAYRVSPGTYNFAYESRIYYANGTYNWTQWGGQYKIWIHTGEKGGEGGIFWQKGDAGKDGVDSYLTLICNYDGCRESRINKVQGISPAFPDSSCSYETRSGAFSMSVTYHLVASGSNRSK